MKYPALVALVFTTCCARFERPQAFPNSSATMVREVSAETVALVLEDADGDILPFCSGVWVGRDQILTAAHCAAMVAPKDAAFPDVANGNPTGEFLEFIIESEVTGQYMKPTGMHGAVVVRLDDQHDLALLRVVGDPPAHPSARLAEKVPDPGDVLHLVGQDHGFYWTYMRGLMSRLWGDLPATRKVGPWLQITAPVSNGMSGSGAFDEAGRLVGICSMIASAPDVAIYVALPTVRAFLK